MPLIQASSLDGYLDTFVLSHRASVCVCTTAACWAVFSYPYVCMCVHNRCLLCLVYIPGVGRPAPVTLKRALQSILYGFINCKACGPHPFATLYLVLRSVSSMLHPRFAQGLSVSRVFLKAGTS
jgi:hypothetical protein